MESIIAVVVNDEHINSTVALCPPVVALDDGGMYRSSRQQHWLWESWLDFWGYVKDKANGRRVIGINNGDLGELDIKRRSAQLISPNKATIQNLVLETLRPAMDVVSSWIIIRGTMAHEGKSCWLEEDLAKDLANTIPYSDTTKSWWHFQGQIASVRMDISHHATMSGLPYTRATAPARLAARIMWHYKVEKEEKAPDIVVRAHNHMFAESGINYACRVFYSPCWSMTTEFGYRTGRENESPSIGGLIFECNGNNGYNWELKSYETIKNRTWKLKI
jgi:hypothetical protein